ncbi:TIGR02206 family membrane protein [Nocardioides guangzhouensis]|nr:TIGR02206 family membrane protein [Nocardioides guangzhouensis]
MNSFHAFSTSHFVMLALFVAGIWPVVRLGRRYHDDPHSPAARRVSRIFAIAIPCFTIPLQLVDLLPGQYSFRSSLPLQLCDLAWIVATLALWTHHRYVVALTYYWGLVLTTQALITPSLTTGFPSPKFIAFWGSHILIVWAAIFLVFGLGLAPRWRDYATTVATTAAWAVTVYVFNVAASTNYGYLNAKPASASLLDFLGPWPTYVVAEIAIIATVWALMTWPWERVRRARAASPTPPASAPSGSSR